MTLTFINHKLTSSLQIMRYNLVFIFGAKSIHWTACDPGPINVAFKKHLSLSYSICELFKPIKNNVRHKTSAPIPRVSLLLHYQWSEKER